MLTEFFHILKIHCLHQNQCWPDWFESIFWQVLAWERQKCGMCHQNLFPFMCQFLSSVWKTKL